MSTIVTRAGKGSPLTHTEVDNNFTNLNTDKLQSGSTASSLTITSADINGGTIDGTTIGSSTPSTGAFTTALVGSDANFTDYPNSKLVSTQSKVTGYGHTYNIGVTGEAKANSSDSNVWGVGVYGKAWTNGGTRCAGLEGDAGVTNSADTGTAAAIRAYSKSTHSGGLNVGITIDVTGSSVNNYALYMQNGDLFSAAAQSWELVDNSNSALRFNTAGKSAILDVVTTNGSEGIATSGNLGVQGTATIATLGVTNTSTLNNVAITGTTSFDGSQGTAGQVLTSAGSGNTPTWTTIDALPSQTGNSGKYLTTDGTNPSWAVVGGGQYFGSATVKAIAYNSNTIGENVTVTTGNNGLSAGPVTISSGFTVTVQSGATWVIV